MPKDDSRALTDHALEELDTDSSPALTDYIIVIDPNTHKPKRVLLSDIQTLINV